MMQATRVRRASGIHLRLATGECIVVTLKSWRKFLARLQNNLLTRKR